MNHFTKTAGMFLAGSLLAGLIAGTLQPAVTVRAEEDAARDYLNSVLQDYAAEHPEEAKKLAQEAQLAVLESEKTAQQTDNKQAVSSKEAEVTENVSQTAAKTAAAEQIIARCEDASGSYILTDRRVLREDPENGMLSLFMPLGGTAYSGLYTEDNLLVLIRDGAEDLYRIGSDRIPVYESTRTQEDPAYRGIGTEAETDSEEAQSEEAQPALSDSLRLSDSLISLPNAQVRQVKDSWVIRADGKLYRLEQEAESGTETIRVFYEPLEGEKLLSHTSWGAMTYVLLTRADGSQIIRGISEDGTIRDIYNFYVSENTPAYTQLTVSDGILSVSSAGSTQEQIFRLGAGGLFGSMNLAADTTLNGILPSVREEAGKELAAADQNWETVVSQLQDMLAEETDAEKAARIQESINMLSEERECHYTFPQCQLTGGVFSSAWQMARFGRIYLIEDGTRLVEIDPSAPEGERRTVYPSLTGASLLTITRKGVLIQENGQIYRITRTESGFDKTLYLTTDAEVVSAGDDGITVGEWRTTEDGLPVYVLSRADFERGVIGELFRSVGDIPGPEAAKTFPMYAECGGRVFYQKAVSGKEYLFERNEESLTQENVMGGALRDRGYAAAGLGLVTRYYAVYQQTDAQSQPETNAQAGLQEVPALVIGIQVPAFSDDYEGSASLEKLLENRFSGFLSTSLDAMKLDPSGCELMEISFSQYQNYLRQGVGRASESIGEVTWADARYVSFSFCDRLSPRGAARDVYANDYYVLDMERGKRLLLKDVVRTGKEELQALVTEGIRQQIAADPASFYENAEAIAAEKNPEDYPFYLTGEGVCVEFGAEELAPYSEGVKTVTIPYEQLALWIVPGKGLDEEE
ncbi:MAG: DUF3298 domain-containing protein [Lachnospiraceae bacterium]|nr:DUF3298 domain-containing protein [Lachnospiraceae bacterium]